MSEAKFNIYSGALKALPPMEAGDNRKRLSTTASSTIRDLPGDEMTLNALQKMAATAERNMTIFLNHSYKVPEDVLGSVEKAYVNQRGDEYDLDFEIRVNEANDRAIKTWEAINSGTQLGCSIGALIPEGGATKTDSGLQINDVKLLEASIVGIPANPRSFVHYAAKALRQAEESEEEQTVEAGSVVLNVTPQTTNDSGSATVTMTAVKEQNDVPGPSGEDEPHRNEEPAADAPPAGDEGEVEEAAEEQPTQKEVPATQEAPEASDPEHDGDPESDEDEDGDEDADEAVKTLGIESLHDLLRQTTSELVHARKALGEETEKRAAAEARADKVENDLKLATQIVERIAALPIGRRTSFAHEVSDFRTKFAGVYSEDMLKLLERKNER